MLPYDPTRQHGTNDLSRTDCEVQVIPGKIDPSFDWGDQPGVFTFCHACDSDDPCLDPPCPICGGTGIDTRPKP